MIGKLIVLSMLVQTQCITTDAQPESPLPSTCNSCCQGQTGREGNPGIPGVPGTNGNPGINGQSGTVGPKGDRGESLKGERGDRGEKGDSGSPGLKGERGLGGLRGLSGKTGPVGVAGPVGSTGLAGVKGEKGEMGQNRVSAFLAVRSSSFTPSSANIPLPFQQFHTNVGDDFDLASGRFTCEVPGIYMFTYSMMTHNTNYNMIQLMKDNAVINSVHDNSDSVNSMLSNAAVLQLHAGDQVWLKCYYSEKVIYSDTNFFTSFSGVLLHEL